MDTVFRLAEKSDIEFISETYNQNIEKLHGVYRSSYDWARLMDDGTSVYFVAVRDKAAGWFRIEIENGILWLGMLQVSPDYQRLGVGKSVVEFVLELAKNKNVKTVGIHTTEDNFAARKLYSSCGFEVSEVGACTTADGVQRVGYTFLKTVCI